MTIPNLYNLLRIKRKKSKICHFDADPVKPTVRQPLGD